MPGRRRACRRRSGARSARAEDMHAPPRERASGRRCRSRLDGLGKRDRPQAPRPDRLEQARQDLEHDGPAVRRDCGVPVVQPRWGSFPEIVERTGGGLTCEPNDVASLADAIHSLWKNPEQANDLAKRGAAGVREHYTVSQMASRALEVYASLQ